MIRVRTASRLHFGFLNLSPQAYWPNLLGDETIAARRFGGAGLMVEPPGVQLTAEPAAAWAAEGPLGERALAYARKITEGLRPAATPPQKLTIEQAPPEHVGLGVGTQLGLAVARALTYSRGLEPLPATALAGLAGRGARSALGIHGFDQGGFLVEGGKRHPEEVSPLIARLPFPEAWRILLVLPAWGTGLYGPAEREAFDGLPGDAGALAATEALCRLVLLGMLPALAAADAKAFGEAVSDFNRRVGALFAPIQGGTYAHAGTAELIAFLHRQGVAGAGQSSWGPAVFAVLADPEQAARLAALVRERFAFRPEEILISRARNHGATVFGKNSEGRKEKG